MKDSVGPGGWGIENPKENEGFCRSMGARTPRGPANFKLRGALSMEEENQKIQREMKDSVGPGGWGIENPQENEGFCRSRGPGHHAEP